MEPEYPERCCVRTADPGAASGRRLDSAWGPPSPGAERRREPRTILIIRRYGERVCGHGTVGLLLDIGDAGRGGDSFGCAVDELGRPQTGVAALRQPPDPPAEIFGLPPGAVLGASKARRRRIRQTMSEPAAVMVVRSFCGSTSATPMPASRARYAAVPAASPV